MITRTGVLVILGIVTLICVYLGAVCTENGASDQRPGLVLAGNALTGVALGCAGAMGYIWQ